MNRYIRAALAGACGVVFSASAFGLGSPRGVALRWVASQPGVVPAGALVAGYNKSGAIYSCNAHYQDALYPGQLTNKGCTISYDGKSFVSKHYKVLVGHAPEVQWVSYPSSYGYTDRAARMAGYLPKGIKIRSQDFKQPIIGGYESNSPSYLHVLYMCRSMSDNQMVVGKVVSNICDVGIDGKEVSLPIMQTLYWVPKQDKSQQPRVLNPIISPPVLLSGRG